MIAIPDIAELFRARGSRSYADEPVTQLEHAWQTARYARKATDDPELELAGWLHDIGHLLTEEDGSPTLRGLDDRHETSGRLILAPLFGQRVAEIVGLHVRAKRYLTTVDPDYLRRLSGDSLRSLALQGGPMTAEEATFFICQPAAADALALRWWDDAAKVAGDAPTSVDAALDDLQILMRNVTNLRS